MGSAPNRSYSADGKAVESHPAEDSWLKFRWVRVGGAGGVGCRAERVWSSRHLPHWVLCRSENSCSLYGVFNGYEGSRVTSFVAQRLSAELLLGQLSADDTEADVRRALQQVPGGAGRGAPLSHQRPGPGALCVGLHTGGSGCGSLQVNPPCPQKGLWDMVACEILSSRTVSGAPLVALAPR